MDDLLTCRICYEQYKEGVRAPVLLPRCGHTFCRPCVAYIQSGNTVICRFCSTEQRVESVEALPTEFSLLAIIAAREFQKAETCKIHEVKLSFWCRTCSEATCGECLFEDHPTHSHDVVRAQKYIQEMRIIARDIGDKFMEALDSREQRFYNRVFKGARAISNALRSVNVLRKDMTEARTLMKGAREVENIGPAKELCDAAKYLGLKWSIQDVNLYPKEKKEENNKTDNKVQEELKEGEKDNANNSEVRESEDESKNKEDIAEKENETKENGDPEKKESKSDEISENTECIKETKEEKGKVKKPARRRYSDSDDSEEEVSRLRKIREEKEEARKKRAAEKEAEEKHREEIMKQVKEERQKKEEEKRKKEEEEKKAIIQERVMGRQARLRLKKAKTMSVVGPEPDEQSTDEAGKLATTTSTNVSTNKTTDDIPTDEQKKENEISVKKKKQEKNQIKSIEEENENESAEEKSSNKNIDKNTEILNKEGQSTQDAATAVSENGDTKENRNKEKGDDDEDKDLDESAENTMVEYEPDDKPGGNKIKIDICQFPAFQIVVEGYGGRLARMEWEDKGLHVYCHQFQELPYDVIIKSAVLYSLVPTKAPLVFLDINGGKHNLGRVYIRLWGHLRRAQNFLTLCLGDLGQAYMCTRFLETYNTEVPGERIKGGDYELNNGHGGKGVIEDLESSTEYALPMESGMISSAGSFDGTESQFMICTESNPESNFVCPFGIVVAGLPIMKQAIHRMTAQDVWIRDCGIVVETTNFQA